MIAGIHRPAVVRVNLSAIKQNIENEKKHLQKGQKIFAVVKANGYGHGAVEVAKTAVKVGVSGFCVAILDEALELRKADIVKPILVLGVVSPEYAPLAAANDISLTAPISAQDAQRVLSDHYNNTAYDLTCHLFASLMHQFLRKTLTWQNMHQFPF